MSDSRKRRGSSAQRCPRVYEVRKSLKKAVTAAAVVLAAAFATGEAHTLQAPKVRATMNDTKRLDWEEHMDDLESRKAFLHYYRMPEETFDKLVQLLAPHLEKNAHMARGCVVF